MINHMLELSYQYINLLFLLKIATTLFSLSHPKEQIVSSPLALQYKRKCYVSWYLGLKSGNRRTKKSSTDWALGIARIS